MSVFSKLSTSKKHGQKMEEDKKQKVDAEPKRKYMHTPQHAYIDALNSTSGANPGTTRESLREAAERRKSRITQNGSQTTMNGLHSAHSSSSAITTMSSWEARKAMVNKEQLQKAAAPVAIGSARKSYQSSPLASVAPSTAAPSTVSSYDRLEMAKLSPAPLKPSLKRPASSHKKTVTIQAPSRMSSPTPPTFDKAAEAPPVTVIQPAYVPLGKTVTIKSIELPGDLSSEEEKEQTVKKGKRRLTTFWRRRSTLVAAAAA